MMKFMESIPFDSRIMAILVRVISPWWIIIITRLLNNILFLFLNYVFSLFVHFLHCLIKVKNYKIQITKALI
jgi:hypothetical protein